MSVMTKHVFSAHAKQRRREMGLTEDQIEATIAEAEVSWSSENGCIVYRRDKLAVVVGAGDVVVTILWNRYDRWEREK